MNLTVSDADIKVLADRLTVVMDDAYKQGRQFERDRIRARAKIAAEKVWRAGDWYVGPQHANLAKFIDALLEDGDAAIE